MAEQVNMTLRLFNQRTGMEALRFERCCRCELFGRRLGLHGLFLSGDTLDLPIQCLHSRRGEERRSQSIQGPGWILQPNRIFTSPCPPMDIIRKRSNTAKHKEIKFISPAIHSIPEPQSSGQMAFFSLQFILLYSISPTPPPRRTNLF